jgi:hypothetical protein
MLPRLLLEMKKFWEQSGMAQPAPEKPRENNT